MVDLHSHILQGIDDGSRSLDESIEMIRQAQKLGFTAISATSHYKAGTYENKDYSQSYERLVDELKKHKIDMKIYPGNELMLDIEGLEALKTGRVKTINNTDYLLVEPVPGMNALALTMGLKKIVALGYLPILAHVERYTHMKIEQLAKMKELGIIYQVNIESIDIYRKRIEKLWEASLIDIVATDAHRQDRRSYELDKKIKSWKAFVGDKSWEVISSKSPMAIIEGKKEFGEDEDNKEKDRGSATGFIYGIFSLWKRDRSR